MSEPTDPQLRDRLRRVLAQADGFSFEDLEPHDYKRAADQVIAVVQAEIDRLAAERDAALGAVERTVQMMHDYNTSARQRGEVFAHVNCRQVIGLLSLTWPDGNYEGASDAH